jgi:hypothetical protein
MARKPILIIGLFILSIICIKWAVRSEAAGEQAYSQAAEEATLPEVGVFPASVSAKVNREESTEAQQTALEDGTSEEIKTTEKTEISMSEPETSVPAEASVPAENTEAIQTPEATLPEEQVPAPEPETTQTEEPTTVTEPEPVQAEEPATVPETETAQAEEPAAVPQTEAEQEQESSCATEPETLPPEESAEVRHESGEPRQSLSLSEAIGWSSCIFRGVCISEADGHGEVRVSVTTVYRGEGGSEILVHTPDAYSFLIGQEYLFFGEKHGNVILDRIYLIPTELVWAENGKARGLTKHEIDGWTYEEVLDALPALVESVPLKPACSGGIASDYIHSSDPEEIKALSEQVIIGKALQFTGIYNDRQWCEFEVLETVKGDLAPGTVITVVLAPYSVEPGKSYTVCCRLVGAEIYIISAPGSIWPLEQ